MIELIKLCFVCCLIFRATFVEAVIDPEEAYEALKKLEANFWLKELIPYDELCSEKECITKSVTKYLEPLCERETFKIVNAKTKKEKSLSLNFKDLDKNLDFSETNLGDVIFNFYRILQCKVDSRDEEYKTNCIKDISTIKTTEQESFIDPYFLEIYIGKNLGS